MNKRIEIKPNDQSWYGKYVRLSSWNLDRYFLISHVGQVRIFGDNFKGNTLLLRDCVHEIDQGSCFWELYEANEVNYPNATALNQLVEIAHSMAIEKGWHEEEINPLVAHALMHSEISEGTEEVRAGKKPIYFEEDNEKPLGEAIELADVVIRIADYFGARKWDLNQAVIMKINYNQNRPYRHGNKAF